MFKSSFPNIPVKTQQADMMVLLMLVDCTLKESETRETASIVHIQFTENPWDVKKMMRRKKTMSKEEEGQREVEEERRSRGRMKKRKKEEVEEE